MVTATALPTGTAVAAAAADTATRLADDACYLALKAHDARFDGTFFTGVTSTGIYCRPVCRVKVPRRQNCRFFRHAAQAEAAGFRPCLRCRPELAPRATPWSAEDASRTLALQAADLISDPYTWHERTAGPAGVAARLGVSDRHLRRIFEAQFGVSPLQYLQTHRLLAAKQLLADTCLPMSQVAIASGFESVRRFNAAFAGRYGLNPRALRKAAAGRREPAAIEVRLGFRPPYDRHAMLAFFERRALDGVEQVDSAASVPQLARTLAVSQGGRTCSGWLRIRFDPTSDRVLLLVSESLAAVLPAVISRARALLDLDADPMAINPPLQASFPRGEGLRVPGTVDGFELAVRAVLGQQVTVAAARTIGSRLVQAFGEPILTPFAGLSRLFPTAAAIAAAGGDDLGRIGIVRQRQSALVALARAVLDGRLELRPGADVPATVAILLALPGIGDWTAQYIAMRALRWPDAFPAGDIALQKALGVTSARAAAEASNAWRPWRSYAVLRAWHALAATRLEETPL